MTRDEAIQDLPRLFSAGLDASTAAELRRWIDEDADVRVEWDRWLHARHVYSAEPPVEDVVAFVEGHLEGEDRDLLEAHLERSEAAREEVALLRQSQALSRQVDGDGVALFGPRRRPTPSRASWRPALIAAVLTATVTSLIWHAMSPQGPIGVNVPIVEVLPESGQIRGEPSAEAVVALNATQDHLVLILVSETDPAAQDLWAEARDQDGRVFWSAGGLVRDPRGEYTVSLRLPDSVEAFTLTIFAVADEAPDGREVDRYQVRLERPSPSP